MKDENDEDSLIDCLSGIAEISKKSDPKFLVLIAGLQDED